jgi:hypothetical protein
VAQTSNNTRPRGEVGQAGREHALSLHVPDPLLPFIGAMLLGSNSIRPLASVHS